MNRWLIALALSCLITGHTFAQLPPDKALETFTVANGLELTLFAEGGEVFRKLKAGQTVRIAPAGVDRKPSSEPVTAAVAAFKMDRNLGKVSLTVTGSTAAFRATELTRVWIKE